MSNRKCKKTKPFQGHCIKWEEALIKGRLFDTNRDYYEINTRHNMDIHTSQVNLTKYGNGVTHGCKDLQCTTQ
jgi:hypothetical protein